VLKKGLYIANKRNLHQKSATAAKTNQTNIHAEAHKCTAPTKRTKRKSTSGCHGMKTKPLTGSSAPQKQNQTQ